MTTVTKTVLLVDDEPHIRYMLQMKLQDAGFRVLIASNGRQAYEIASTRFPSVVITDFQMPQSDGLELCQKLAENDQTAHIPIVMLTARGHRIPKEVLGTTNVKELLAKPFSLRDLLRKVDQLTLPPSDGSAAGASAA